MHNPACLKQAGLPEHNKSKLIRSAHDYQRSLSDQRGYRSLFPKAVGTGNCLAPVFSYSGLLTHPGVVELMLGDDRHITRNSCIGQTELEQCPSEHLSLEFLS